jgi:hypothetical protein
MCRVRAIAKTLGLLRRLIHDLIEQIRLEVRLLNEK